MSEFELRVQASRNAQKAVWDTIADALNIVFGFAMFAGLLIMAGLMA